MNFILLILSVFLSLSISASVCESALFDKDHYEIERFFGHGQSLKKACSEAKSKCKRALARRGGKLTCKLLNQRNRPQRPTPPIPSPNQVSCQTLLRARDGYLLFRYRSNATNLNLACHKSRVNCERELHYLRANGTYWGQYCQTPRRSSHWITRSCQVNQVDGRRGFIQTHIAWASGVRGSGVMSLACLEARRKCHSWLRPGQICLN